MLLGRVAGIIVVNEFGTRGADKIVGVTLMQSEDRDQVKSDRLQICPAAGSGPRVCGREFPRHGPSIVSLPDGNCQCRVGVTPSDACGLGRASVAASPAPQVAERLRFSRHRVAALPHHCRLQGPPLPPMPGQGNRTRGGGRRHNAGSTSRAEKKDREHDP